MINTSSGIIRNEHLPRVGVVNLNSLADFFYDEYIMHGINLTWSDAIEELRKELTNQGKSDDEIDEACEDLNISWENDCDFYLIGDWKRLDNGQYAIDRDGANGFAGTYSSSSGTVCIEWSNTVKHCGHTSPCYVMANGDGPCGDLDSPGNTVLAYSLPLDLFNVYGE